METTRQARATWSGNLADGNGTVVSGTSGAFPEMPITWTARTQELGRSHEPGGAARRSACRVLLDGVLERALEGRLRAGSGRDHGVDPLPQVRRVDGVFVDPRRSGEGAGHRQGEVPGDRGDSPRRPARSHERSRATSSSPSTPPWSSSAGCKGPRGDAMSQPPDGEFRGRIPGTGSGGAQPPGPAGPTGSQPWGWDGLMQDRPARIPLLGLFLVLFGGILLVQQLVPGFERHRCRARRRDRHRPADLVGDQPPAVGALRRHGADRDRPAPAAHGSAGDRWRARLGNLLLRHRPSRDRRHAGGGAGGVGWQAILAGS